MEASYAILEVDGRRLAESASTRRGRLRRCLRPEPPSSSRQDLGCDGEGHRAWQQRGLQSFVSRRYEPLSIWQQYATDVRGNELPVGHFLPEEAPDLVTAALRDFFDQVLMSPERETRQRRDQVRF